MKIFSMLNFAAAAANDYDEESFACNHQGSPLMREFSASWNLVLVI